jgi:hypothetical protein
MRSRVVAFSFAALAIAQGALADEYYVSGDVLNVRLCPAEDCPITNQIYRGQKVTVYEHSREWARVSEFYDSRAEKLEFSQISSDTVARWVTFSYLSTTKPEKLKQPQLDGALADPRIKGIPDAGEYGLTSEDVISLRKYAAELLESGECSGIEYGDKSTTKTNTYFVNCTGENKNRFFTR